MTLWDNERLIKLETRLNYIENHINGTLWFRKELMLLLKKVGKKVGVDFSDIEKENEDFFSKIKKENEE